MSEKKCPCCGASIDLYATECKYCGETVAQPVQNTEPVQQNAQPVQQQYMQQPQQTQQQYTQPQQQYTAVVGYKSKTTAGILAILLGGIGVHKFYLGKIGIGNLYVLFCWTYIPAIIGLIEGIIYLTSSDEKFISKYCKVKYYNKNI